MRTRLRVFAAARTMTHMGPCWGVSLQFLTSPRASSACCTNRIGRCTHCPHSNSKIPESQVAATFYSLDAQYIEKRKTDKHTTRTDHAKGVLPKKQSSARSVSPSRTTLNRQQGRCMRSGICGYTEDGGENIKVKKGGGTRPRVGRGATTMLRCDGNGMRMRWRWR